MIPGAQFLAAWANLAGASGYRVPAKQQGSSLQGQGGFADPVWASKKIGVSKTSAFYGPGDEGNSLILTKNRKKSHTG